MFYIRSYVYFLIDSVIGDPLYRLDLGYTYAIPIWSRVSFLLSLSVRATLSFRHIKWETRGWDRKSHPRTMSLYSDVDCLMHCRPTVGEIAALCSK